jgi:hypothetical protein
MLDLAGTGGFSMRRAALTLMALSAPMAMLPACAEPISASAPTDTGAPFYTTDPSYFANPPVYTTDPAYLAGGPLYTNGLAYFIAPVRAARFGGYCPPQGGHGLGHHR